MKIKCIIIDDEEPARRLIANYLSKLPDFEICGSFKSPLDALPLLSNDSIDLLFLDIRMPDISGLDFLKILSQRPQVIITTAYREFALEGFELEVLDYLVKPIEFSRFLKATNRILPKHTTTEQSPETSSKSIKVKADRKVYNIKLSDILYIESNNEYVVYHTTSHGKLMVHEALKNIEKELASFQFCRIHRSFIINLQHVAYTEGNQVAIRQQHLPISESYKKAFQDAWK